MTTEARPGVNPPSTGRIDRASWMAMGLALATAIGHLAARPSPDVAWNLYVTRTLLAGGRLGGDVFENSPPMIFLFNAPAVMLADLGGWREWPAWVVLVLALAGAAIALSLRQTLRPEWPAIVPQSWWGAATLAVLIVVPGDDFGQRDHVTAILILPYLMLVARRTQGGTTSRGGAVIIGAMAAAGIGIKPHFALLALATWLWLARRGGLRAILTPEHITVCVVGATYAILVATLLPGYFAYAATYGPLYQRFHTEFLPIGGTLATIPPWAQAALGSGAIPAYLALGAYATVRDFLREGERPLAGILATGTAAMLLAALVQGKGWWYHFLPATTVAGLLITCLVACTARRRPRLVARIYLAIGTATVVALIAATMPGTFLRLARPGDARLDADRNLSQLLPLAAAVGPAGHVGVLSTNIASSFPLVLEARSRWALRHPSLWPLVAFYEEQVPGQARIAIRDYAVRSELERQFTDEVVEDLVRTKPELLLVLRPDSSTTRWGGARRFDYLAYFGTHPTFRDSVFPVYAAAGSAGDYDVFWRRTTADRE